MKSIHRVVFRILSFSHSAGRIPALFTAGCVAFLSGCSAPMNLPGHWNDHKIVVDGRNSEWDVTYLIDDNKLVIGCVNDSDFVYLLLATNDRPLAMSMLRGLTVWFDPKGGTNKVFGLRYPLGGMFGRGDRGRQEGVDRQLEPPQGLEMMSTEIEILGPGSEDAHKMQLMETGGIQAKLNFTGSTYVCEMRIPYRDSYPFSIKAVPATVIGLGLETSQIRAQRGNEGGERDRNQGEGEQEGGGEYGRGGMRGGRGGFGQGGSRTTEQLDIWMKTPLIVKGGIQIPPPGEK